MNRDCVFVFARLFINPTGNAEKEISSSHTCSAYIWECIVCLFRRRSNTSALYYIKIPISLLCAELAGFNNRIHKKKKKIESISFQAHHHEISNTFLSFSTLYATPWRSFRDSQSISSSSFNMKSMPIFSSYRINISTTSYGQTINACSILCMLYLDKCILHSNLARKQMINNFKPNFWILMVYFVNGITGEVEKKFLKGTILPKDPWAADWTNFPQDQCLQSYPSDFRWRYCDRVLSAKMIGLMEQFMEP